MSFWISSFVLERKSCQEVAFFAVSLKSFNFCNNFCLSFQISSCLISLLSS